MDLKRAWLPDTVFGSVDDQARDGPVLAVVAADRAGSTTFDDRFITNGDACSVRVKSFSYAGMIAI